MGQRLQQVEKKAMLTKRYASLPILFQKRYQNETVPVITFAWQRPEKGSRQLKLNYQRRQVVLNVTQDELQASLFFHRSKRQRWAIREIIGSQQTSARGLTTLTPLPPPTRLVTQCLTVDKAKGVIRSACTSVGYPLWLWNDENEGKTWFLCCSLSDMRRR